MMSIFTYRVLPRFRFWPQLPRALPRKSTKDQPSSPLRIKTNDLTGVNGDQLSFTQTKVATNHATNLGLFPLSNNNSQHQDDMKHVWAWGFRTKTFVNATWLFRSGFTPKDTKKNTQEKQPRATNLTSLKNKNKGHWRGWFFFDARLSSRSQTPKRDSCWWFRNP